MDQGAEFTKCITVSDLTTKTLDDDITLVDRDSGGCCPADSVPGIQMSSKYHGAQIVCGFKDDGTIKMSSSSSNGAKTCTINKCYVMKQNIPCKDDTKQLLNGCCGAKPQTNFDAKCKFYDQSAKFNGVTATYCTTYHKTYKMENTAVTTDDIKDNVLQVDKLYTYTACEGSSLASGAAAAASKTVAPAGASKAVSSASITAGLVVAAVSAVLAV